MTKPKVVTKPRRAKKPVARASRIKLYQSKIEELVEERDKLRACLSTTQTAVHAASQLVECVAGSMTWSAAGAVLSRQAHDLLILSHTIAVAKGKEAARG